MGHFSFGHAKILIKCSLPSNFEMREVEKKLKMRTPFWGPKGLKMKNGQKWTKDESFTISINSN